MIYFIAKLQFNSEKTLVTDDLVRGQSWNHFERLALGEYGTRERLYYIVGYDTMTTVDDFVQIMNYNLYFFNSTPSISRNKTDLDEAVPYAQSLRNLGKLVIVASCMSNGDAFRYLTEAENIITWSDCTNRDKIAENIMSALDQTTNSTVPPAPTTTTTTTVTTTTTSPSVTTSVSSATTTSFRRTDPTHVPPLSCIKDVVLLIDSSSALKEEQFNQMKNFIMRDKGLLMMLPVSPDQIELGVYSYFSSINQIIDFDTFGVDELISAINTTLTLTGGKPNLARALRFATEIHHKRGLNVNTFTLVLAASSETADSKMAKDAAYNLTSNGNVLATLGFGTGDLKPLNELASSQDFVFTSETFDASNEIALKIRDAICLPAPTHATTPTTQSPTQSTTVHPDLKCKADIVIMIDTSNALTSLDAYGKEIDYIQLKLSPSWKIGVETTEAKLLLYDISSTETHGSFAISDNNEFDKIVALVREHFKAADPSITNGISLVNGLFNDSRKDDVKKVLLLFTYSSLHTDIYSASEVAKQLIGNSVNIVVVGVGGKVDRSYLEALSGTVLNYASLDNVDANAINSKLCLNPIPPKPLPPTTTTTSTTSTTITTITLPPLTTS
ncbi:unnamed protein product [Enterobius vermicularis]|uniref:VWFA domain-containing protein n=1 Tax=Enterobius vermicularis TaxID=51028 RepID=A0A0N4UVA1_ENTVE|nr:unnamed protein product [Enterobius vermicularis]